MTPINPVFDDFIVKLIIDRMIDIILTSPVEGSFPRHMNTKSSTVASVSNESMKFRSLSLQSGKVILICDR